MIHVHYVERMQIWTMTNAGCSQSLQVMRMLQITLIAFWNKLLLGNKLIVLSKTTCFVHT